MKKYRSKNSKNRWVCCIDVSFDASRQQWRWEIHHNDVDDDPRNLVMQSFCDDEATAIATCEEVAERHVEQSYQKDTQHIHQWFGLTYASYLVLPQSLMQTMPELWQLSFAELMEEFGNTFDYLAPGHSYRVQLRRHVDTVDDEEVYEDLDDPLAPCGYLVMPRSLMQAMLGPWQLCFVELMEEFDNTFDYLESDHSYRVQLQCHIDTVDDEEVYEDLDDPLSNYRYPPDLSPYCVNQGVTAEGVGV